MDRAPDPRRARSLPVAASRAGGRAPPARSDPHAPACASRPVRPGLPVRRLRSDGARDPAKLAAWAATTGGKAVVGSFADAAGHGEIVMNATAGSGSLAALQMAGADRLKGKILVDLSNPLDFSRGMPPTLLLSNTESLGEKIQAALPAARVVKAFNTVSSVVMIDPGKVGGGEHHLLICGNDPQAKAAVAARMEEWFGWKHIMDLGDITMARGLEMYLPLWLRLFGVLKTPAFNIRVVT